MDAKSLSLKACIFLILIFGIAAYSNTFSVPFHFDDHESIVNNPVLRSLQDPGRIWSFRPSRFIANMSFALQYVLTGSEPWGFHLLNLLIHLLVGVTVFGITRLLLRTPALRDTVPASYQDLFALAPALLFLTHPVQTQAVTYIFQRTTSLATLFYLAALWMYLKARLEKARYYGLVFPLMLAAMLTKEISFTLPFAILLTDFCFFPVSGEETVLKKFRRWLPFAAFLVLIPLFYIRFPEHSVPITKLVSFTNTKMPRGDYFLTEFRVLRTYLGLLFFPAEQYLTYDYRISSGLGDLDTWAAFTALFGIFILALAFFKKHRLLSFGILWFFLAFSVESSLIPLPDVIFEHRLYLPMFGFAVFLTALLWRWARSPSRFMAVILLLAVVGSGMTYARNEVWKSPVKLWEDVVRKYPRKMVALNNLGILYARQGRNMEAKQLFEQSLRLYPGDELPYENMGVYYLRSGEPEKAIGYLEKAVERNPRACHAWYNLGNAYMTIRRYERAIQCYERALSTSDSSRSTLRNTLRGTLPKAHDALATAYVATRQYDRAVFHYKKILELDPKHKDAADKLTHLQNVSRERSRQ